MPAEVSLFARFQVTRGYRPTVSHIFHGLSSHVLAISLIHLWHMACANVCTISKARTNELEVTAEKDSVVTITLKYRCMHNLTVKN